ncbi:MAG: calcium-binding protein [Pseudomonadota bacterium]
MQSSMFITIIAATAIGLSTLSAMARDRGPDFSALDADGNGEVSLQEMQASAQARFVEADADGDGFLSATELEARAEKRAKDRSARVLARLDANEDGKLSPEEMRTNRRDPARFFERLDADNSGGISQQEFEQARASFRKRVSGSREN